MNNDAGQGFRGRHVLIDYTNHAGVRQVRTIEPADNGIFFGISKWHPDPQWLLEANDIGKSAPRTFAMKDINWWGVQPVRPTVDDIPSCGSENNYQHAGVAERQAHATGIAEGIARASRVDSSIAAQLQRSMEMNARVKVRLQKPHAVAMNTAVLDSARVAAAIEAILKDEEPTW